MSLTWLETAEVNFIEFHIKVKRDKMVPFFESVKIPWQGHGHHQWSDILLFVYKLVYKQRKRISANLTER